MAWQFIRFLPHRCDFKICPHWILDVERTFSLEENDPRYGLAGSIRTDVVLRNEQGEIIAFTTSKRVTNHCLTREQTNFGPRPAPRPIRPCLS